MAKTIGEALQLFAKVGQFDILNIEMNNNRDTEHKILHRFKEVLILPIHCITNNLDFIMCKGKKLLLRQTK